jgi:uncharacterized protein YxeA
MIVVIILVVVAVIVLAAAAMLVSRRRQADGVNSFRRQIDALSPEARRPVVDQIQHARDDEDDADGT